MPLSGAAPDLADADLAPLLARRARTRLVGLGEATHGDRESFRFKHRLIRALVRHHGCRLLIFERGVAEMDAYDRYITGAAATLSMGAELAPWLAEEVRDLFLWLRAWNDAGGRVRLAGMDMQSPAGLPMALRLLDEAGIGAPAAWRRLAEEVGAHGDDVVWLEGALATWHAAAPPLLDRSDPHHRWIALLADNARQWWEFHACRARGDWRRGDALRDPWMARNALAHLERLGPGTSAALWAHNTHVWLAPNRVGGHLRAQLGVAYRCVGFAFGRGAFRAGTLEPGKDPDWTPRRHTAAPPPPGSMEHLLDQLDLPCYAVEPAAVAALRREQPIRHVGTAVVDGPGQFAQRRCVPADVYDLLVYFREIRPARPFAGPWPRD